MSSSKRLVYGPAPESDSAVRAWLRTGRGQLGHFINGRFSQRGRGWFTTREPATGKQLARLPLAGPAEVRQAVAAARKAQPRWARSGGYARAKAMYALARMLQKHARLFAVLESLDNGKPVRETRDIDVPLAARHFYHHAGWAQLQDERFATHRPVGVVGQIIPWNFPLLMLAWKIAPALALGNAVVLKPAEQAPLTALLFAELAAKAGLPAGVLNIITGDGTTGAALVDAEGLDKLAFTGSTAVGKEIRRRTAGRGLSLSLELGGKSPFIVFSDADLDAAVEGVVDGVWFNQGEVCCAGSRLLVQEGAAARMLAKLRRRLDSMRVGDPLDKNTDVGAIISGPQLKRITKLVDGGVAEGGQLFQAALPRGLPSGGCFYPPTLVLDAPPASEIATEEIFGPVLVAHTFRTSAEAIALANNTRYGLAASVYAESGALALEVARRLQAGVVWVNSTNLFDAAVGFGGYRESGFGREGGIEGAYEYLKPIARPAPPPKTSRRKRMLKTTGTADDIDQTSKHYIGGKQRRPDGGYAYAVADASGKQLGYAARGNRKDVRDAVQAARDALDKGRWNESDPHLRAQLLYHLAEKLAKRRDEFAQRLRQIDSGTAAAARGEVEQVCERLFSYAAWCDKHEGVVHRPPLRGLALALPEPLGVVGAACPDEQPLLSFISLLAPLLAAGNAAVMLPSARSGLLAADFYEVVETSDLPAGVVNIITGPRADTLSHLAGHLDVDGMWCFGGGRDDVRLVEELAAGNVKSTHVGAARDWSAADAQGEAWLRRATQVKNIWLPHGD